MRLSDLNLGQTGYISHVDGDAKFVRRLVEMGFISGEEVKVSSKAPLADPREYIVRGTSITLRRSEAQQIKVAPLYSYASEFNCSGKCSSCTIKSFKCNITDPNNHSLSERKTIRVALVGNPNSGKTTLFNRISGGHEHIANYAGCTVDSHVGKFEWDGFCIELVDLPGTYSLTTFSPEEQYVEDYLSSNKPDVILNIIDATNLQRNLYLTTQLYSLGIPMIGALNMFDELEKHNNTLNTDELSKRLGFPCIPVVSRSGKGLHELLDEIIKFDTFEYNYPQFRYDDSTDVNEKAKTHYQFINLALKHIYRVQTDKERVATKIDNIVTHRFWGYPIFLFVLYAMFQLTFTIGEYPMLWIEEGVALIGGLVGEWLPEGWFNDMIVDGIIGGIGSVIVFLPNILILYFCISILDDTGYMARAAYIMDRLMRAIGLHGRSFIPMIMGFGCSVPAIIATRSIENHRARLLTMLVTPFMSCSARLPVYLLFAGAFFPDHAGLVLTGIYLAGIVAAIVAAKIFDLILSKRHNNPYIMELPSYRVPFLRSAISRMWDKGSQYLRKMGTVILFASILIWVLGYFPQNDTLTPSQQQEQSYLGRLGKAVSPVFEPMGTNWQMNVGIIAGLGAKEVVVSSLGILNNIEEESTEDFDGTLGAILTKDISANSALAYMLFILLYMPCLASIIAIGREAGHWKWALISAVYTTAFAWIVAVVVYQLSILL